MSHTAKITLLLLIHNSEKDLNKFFGWLKNSKSVGQIVAIDDSYSKSNAICLQKLINKKQELVFKTNAFIDFSNQRNFGLSFCKNEWVLWLDPDEEVTNEFIYFINNFKPKSHFSAYSFIRKELFLKHLLNHGPTTKDYLTRLFRKNSGKFYGQVHEIWKTTKPIKKQSQYIYHHSNDTVSYFFDKINFYSSLRANELFTQKKRVSFADIFLYPLGKFIDIYFLKLGFLDGIYGTIFAFGMSFHSFLVRSKLWHLYSSQSVG